MHFPASPAATISMKRYLAIFISKSPITTVAATFKVNRKTASIKNEPKKVVSHFTIAACEKFITNIVIP